MNANRLTAGLACASLLAAFALAACDRPKTASQEPPATVGQKIDNAIDRTQQKLTEAGDKTMQEVSEVGQKTGEALSSAADTVSTKANDAVAAVQGATATAATGEAARAVSDTAITASIKTDFLKDPDLSVLKIDVATKGGVVTLNGLAGDEPARQRAEKLASGIKGVKEVRNFLVVKRA
jgi:hyperosmotically inducible periplasmic protein